jgi:hypothetical protein
MNARGSTAYEVAMGSDLDFFATDPSRKNQDLTPFEEQDRTIKQFQTGFDAPDHWWGTTVCGTS